MKLRNTNMKMNRIRTIYHQTHPACNLWRKRKSMKDQRKERMKKANVIIKRKGREDIVDDDYKLEGQKPMEMTEKM